MKQLGKTVLISTLVGFGCGSSHSKGDKNADPTTPAPDAPLGSDDAVAKALVGRWQSGCIVDADDDLGSKAEKVLLNFGADGQLSEERVNYSDEGCAKVLVKAVLTFTYKTGQRVAAVPGAATLDLVKGHVSQSLLDPTQKSVADLCSDGGFLQAGKASDCAPGDIYQIVKVGDKVLLLGALEDEKAGVTAALRPKVLNSDVPYQLVR